MAAISLAIGSPMKMSPHILTISTILLFANNVKAVLEQNPIVNAPAGSIRGVRADDGDYSKFMGIPYATVDDDNVFGDAIYKLPFEGIFDAVNDSAICPQIEEFTFVGSLDCLHINVYVPDAINAARPLPVMVFIYGGGFSFGHAGRIFHGPKYIIRHDVILVTLNYRLGPYGFMCLDSPAVGNQGLKDQALALLWVQENIGAFGGDLERITLFGNSAGAISTDLHLISNNKPMARNIILQSGSAAMFLISEPDPTVPVRLAGILGSNATDASEALEFLSKVEPSNLITTAENNDFLFAVCVEKLTSPSNDSFLNNYPNNMGRIESYRDRSVMLGVNSDEFLEMVANTNPDMIHFLQGFFREMLNNRFDFENNQTNVLERIVENFYIGGQWNHDIRKELADFGGDITFVYPSVRSVKRYLDNDMENVFFYEFSYDGGRNFFKVTRNISEPGAAHADELGYLFDMADLPNEVTPEDQLILDRMTTLWTNFAKYNNPTPETTPLLPVKWEPITKDSPLHYLKINSELKFDDAGFNHVRMSFWDLFYEAYGENERGHGYVPSSSTLVLMNPVLGSVTLGISLLISLKIGS